MGWNTCLSRCAVSLKECDVFEDQYNDQMAAEVQRLEARQRAVQAGHPEWDNACRACGCRLEGVAANSCERCLAGATSRK